MNQQQHQQLQHRGSARSASPTNHGGAVARVAGVVAAAWAAAAIAPYVAFAVGCLGLFAFLVLA